MENTSLKYDLFDIIRVGKKWKKAILGFAFVAAIIASVYYFIQKTTFKAYGSFFPASAVISGRINLMRETNQDWIDYFGGENEVDRATVVGNSANVISFLIDSFKIAEHYNIDVKSDKNAGQKVYKRFMKNFSMSRSGFKHIEVNFVDEDHELAAMVVNVAMNKTEEHLRKLYIKINDELANAISIRKDSLGKALQTATDTLVAMRVKYGIYDLISPGRKGLNAFTPKSSGITYAEGIEVIQNLEEIKDRLTMDRAKYLSLYNEFKTATYAGIPMIHVTQWATSHGPKAGPFRTLGVVSVFAIACIFGLLLAVVIDLLEKNKTRL